MGKGGSSTEAKPVLASTIAAPPAAGPKGRSFLANTVPAQPTDECKITKRSLRECIPAHCFVRSYAHSFGALAWDLVMVVVAWQLAHYAAANAPAALSPLIWAAYWFYQGLTCTGLWVLAHECGHGGFTDSRLVNDAVGFCIHSALMTPYFSWALTHAKHHHYTNHMTMGETWVPSTADPAKRSVIAAKTTRGTATRIALVAFAGWYTYLLSNETGARQNKGASHFRPSARALFKPKDGKYVVASNVGMLLMGGVLCASVARWGLLAVVRTYLVPQTITNFYLCAITFMQHTHPDVPHFNGDEWTWLRGALSTIDRTMGPYVDAKLRVVPHGEVTSVRLRVASECGHSRRVSLVYRISLFSCICI